MRHARLCGARANSATHRLAAPPSRSASWVLDDSVLLTTPRHASAPLPRALTPSRPQVHTMASVHGNCAEEMSTILFYGYMVGIVAIPFWLTLFLFTVKQTFREENAVEY